MNLKSNLKYIWLSIGVLAVGSMIFYWFGFESNALKNSILALNALMFVLSVPCSLFFVPVAAAADYYLEIEIFSAASVYLNTVFLFVLGFMQWFWLARFWYPAETAFQKFDLLGD